MKHDRSYFVKSRNDVVDVFAGQLGRDGKQRATCVKVVAVGQGTQGIVVVLGELVRGVRPGVAIAAVRALFYQTGDV